LKTPREESGRKVGLGEQESVFEFMYLVFGITRFTPSETGFER
jgi:hypothetical protein